ncbi:MAG: rod shape-determining protein MreC [Spirochaetes bacterium]|nr:rod shape-determining protein MreC [Spirochaetota bacterium]HNV44577.1 rod shape-determining protein MreC [Exilispira sp.]HOV45528.1 rod shape-determining protein MreC [Exilispira sp.]
MNQYFLKNKFTIFFIIFIVISIISMFFTTSSFILTPKVIFGAISYPFVKAYTFVVQNTLTFFSSLKELNLLKQENVRLNEELKQLKEAKFKLELLERENKELKQMLKLKEEAPYDVLPAQIILKDPTNLYSVITINRGSNDNIKKGLAVYAIQDGEKIIVGKVIEVNFFYSKVMTVFDARSSISVKELYSNYSGIARGDAPTSNLLQVEYFPNEADIFFNDIFITAGFGGIFPPGILVGKVVDVQKQNFSLYQKITLKPLIDFSKIQYVFVILNYEITEDYTESSISE